MVIGANIQDAAAMDDVVARIGGGDRGIKTKLDLASSLVSTLFARGYAEGAVVGDKSTTTTTP